jgi:ligand-binding sensor domain-containing protein
MKRLLVRDFFFFLVRRAGLAMLWSLAALHASAAPSSWQQLAPTMFEHLVPAERGFPSPVTMSIAQDGDGFVWFGTQAGLGRWDGYRMRNFFHHADDPRSLPGDFVQTMHVDAQGRLWVGSSTAGLAMYDKRSETFVRYPAGPKGLSSPAVTALASDAHGVWVGTAAGLDYIDLSQGGAISHYPRAVNAAGGCRRQPVDRLQRRPGAA